MPLHAWSSAHYAIALPAGHRFPIAKYALLREAVLAEGVVLAAHLHDPARAPLEDVRRVHDAAYLDRLVQGTMPAAEQRRLGFPWSEGLVERSFRACGGTLEAAAHALRNGIAMNLAGGTHHAFASHGEGFCVLNDVAVAVRALRARGLVERVAVIDLDVHQGNGTHAILADDEASFTFSMHGGRNYPFRKVPGRLDIELEDGTGDAEYLERLAGALPGVLAAARPDIVFYLAGADPHEGDTLGRLKLSFDGLMRRDALVLESARAVGVPVAIAIAGGYGREMDDTVRVHLNTARIARDFLRDERAGML
ncbi:MAG: histone deacetylase [Gemmatimonadetes bacterium]|nr:histone deacetylase [Gemmatimonadota bacterium]